MCIEASGSHFFENIAFVLFPKAWQEMHSIQLITVNLCGKTFKYKSIKTRGKKDNGVKKGFGAQQKLATRQLLKTVHLSDFLYYRTL